MYSYGITEINCCCCWDEDVTIQMKAMVFMVLYGISNYAVQGGSNF